jgi:hypothetical protein
MVFGVQKLVFAEKSQIIWIALQKTPKHPVNWATTNGKNVQRIEPTRMDNQEVALKW